jgi:LuxR family maltose regulon positive regulatory protein
MMTDTFKPVFSGKTIPRPDLYQKLNRAVERGRQLICLTAPAGYGKTVLISSWLQTCDGISIWVSCDSTNSDFPRFISRLIISIQSCNPDFGSEISSLLPSLKSEDFSAIQNIFFSDLSTISEPVCICFDDYHVIEDIEIHQFLALLVDRLTEKSTLILISRTKPALPIARFRVRGQLLELTAGDLRFSNEETKAFIQANHELSLPDRLIDTLTGQTEGWAAAIHLAAMVIASGKSDLDTSSFIQSISGNQQYIADFLMEEVFSLQEKSVQAFLLNTSMVDRFNIHLSAALSGISVEKADSLIEYLNHANLFLIPLDTENQWFRYHHLFLSFLRSRLTSKHPGDIDRLLSIASEWFSSEGLLEEAVDCATRRVSPDQAVHLILENWPNILHQGNIDLMIKWCKRLPASVFKRYPGMNIAYAWSLALQGHFSGVPSLLDSFDQSITETLQSEPDFMRSREGKRLQIEKALVMALLEYSRQQFEQGLKYSGMAREMAHPDFPLLEGNAWIISGHLYKQMGKISEALMAFQKGIPVTWKEGNTQATIGAYVALVTLLVDQGKLQEAIETCDAGIRLAIEYRMDGTPAAAPLLITLASIMIEMNRLDEAEEMLNKGLASGRVNHSLTFLTNSAIAQIKLLTAREKPIEALEIVEGVSHYLGNGNDPQAFADFQALHCLLQSISAEEGCSSKLPGKDLSSRFEQFHAAHSSILLHIKGMAATGQLSSASGYLDKCIALCEESGMTGVLIRCLIVRSRILDATGDSAGSKDDLRRAHELGDPCGYVRSFIDEPVYSASKKNQPVPSPREKNEMIFPLTTREGEILSLIKQGLSNEEIASRLCISLSTVKKHASSIFQKMGVSSRAQAIITDLNKKGS